MLNRLLPETRRRILTLLLLHPDEELHFREIVRRLGCGKGAVERELANLVEAGILQRASRGNLVLYQADKSCPVFADLYSLLAKTEGLREIVLDTIESLNGIDLALIFGSAASGTLDKLSDIDLLLVGDADFGEVSVALLQPQKILGRDIAPTLYTSIEFRRRLGEHHHFLRGILENPYILLKGSLHDFR